METSICLLCGEAKTNDCFYVLNKEKNYKSSYCKECYKTIVKNKLREKNKTKIICECGQSIIPNNLNRHKKTDRHVYFLLLKNHLNPASLITI